MDILVCMAGTGGTGFGTASYLRSRNPNLQVVLVQPHPDSRLTPEHPDAQIIDGVLPAYDVPESALSDYLRPDWSDACINVRTFNFCKVSFLSLIFLLPWIINTFSTDCSNICFNVSKCSILSDKTMH